MKNKRGYQVFLSRLRQKEWGNAQYVALPHCGEVANEKEKLGFSQEMRRENSLSQSEIVGENVESKGLDIEDSPNAIVNIVVEYICLFAIFHPFYDANGDG